MPDADIAFLKALAEEAGALLMTHFGRLKGYERKGARDLVTTADKEAEQLIVRRIRERFPEDAILAEESSNEEHGESRLWIVDPLDGTTNFVHGLPHFAVSIAWVIDGKPRLGCVYNPFLGECFSAESGGGAFLGGERVSVSGTAELSDAVLATGFHYQRESLPDSNVAHFSDLVMRVRGVRRLGSAACDLCYLAMGRYDGFWELELSPWDVAAGGLIAEEAGAKVSDFRGGDDWLYGRQILAAAPGLHAPMARVLGDADPTRLPGPLFRG